MTLTDASTYTDIGGRANITTATLYVTGPSASDVSEEEIDLTATLQAGTTYTLDPEDVGLSEDDQLTDGVWQFQITITSAEPTVDTVVYGLAKCTAECCIQGRIGNLAVEEIAGHCSDPCTDKLYAMYVQLQGATYSFNDAKYTDAQRKIDEVNNFCDTDCDCGCS